MPRSSEEQEDSVNSVSRRRAVASRVAARRTGVRVATTRRPVRNETNASVRVVEDTPSERVDLAASERKAPTGIADDKALQQHKQKRLVVISILIMIGIGASAMVGFTDQGEIDVMQTIEARNERIRSNQATEQDILISTIEVPVQDTNERKADGGLKGRGTGGATPQPQVIMSTSTASTTDVMASTTDMMASTTNTTTNEAGEVEMESEPTEEATQIEAAS